MSGTYFTGDDDTEILKNSIILSFPEGDNIGNKISTISPRSNVKDLEKFCSYDGYDRKNRPTQLFENSIDFSKLCEGDNAPDIQLEDMEYESGSEPVTPVDSPSSRDSMGVDVIDNELLMAPAAPEPLHQYVENEVIPQKLSRTKRLRRSFGKLFGAKKYQKKKKPTKKKKPRPKRGTLKRPKSNRKNKSKKKRKTKHTKRQHVEPNHSFLQTAALH